MENLKVIIVGAGIGGLMAGIACKQAGYEVEVYDRVIDLRPVGAGISLWSNGVKVLNRFGLGQEIAAVGGLMNQMQYRTHTGELLNDIDLSPLVHEVGQRPYPVARADLQKLLLDGLGDAVQLGHCCAGIQQTQDQVTAIFENGHTTTGDVLIAADGIRSVCRKYVLSQEVHAEYVGYVNWNGLVPASEDLAPKDRWVIYVGEHKRASLMPVGGDRFYFFFDVPMEFEAAQQPGETIADLTQFFQGWADPVQTLIRRITPETTNRVLIHSLGPLDTMVNGRIALLGDAAHTTCPDLGQGGAQALEDAYVLVHYLTTTNLSVADALKRYEAARVGRTGAVVAKARNRAEQIHGKDPAITQQWYEQLRTEAPTEVTGAIAKVILGGPMT
jgi:FAD-dependent urate hydroxylase